MLTPRRNHTKRGEQPVTNARRDAKALVEKTVKKVYLKDKQKHAFVLQGSPHIQDPANGVLEA